MPSKKESSYIFTERLKGNQAIREEKQVLTDTFLGFVQ